MAGDVTSGKAGEIVDGTRSALARLGLHRPRNRRWPVRVDLAELAQDLGPDGGKSLLRWLSEKVSLRAEIDLTPAALQQWLRAWPWLLVLDGLDEVTSPEVRRRITDEIEAFTEAADEADADLLVVVTTRPTGYTERIAPEHFAQFDLRYLDAVTAAGYGRLVTSLRLADDLDRRDQVLARFERHLADPAMARLMQTPLQVLIMTVILERAGNLPPDRYQLFWRYYETVYDREAAKNTPIASLLTRQRRTITELHQAVGLTLQMRGEESAGWKAILPLPELHRLAEDRLLELGHELGPETRALTESIVTTATKRLVLLVPAEDDSVAFEIRPLQELMAGRALSDGTDDEVRRRLTLTDALAGNPRSRAAAQAIVKLGDFGSPIPGMAPPRGGQGGESDRGRSNVERIPRNKSTRMDSLLRPQLAGISESPATLAKVERALAELSRVRLRLGGDHPMVPALPYEAQHDWKGTLEALRDPDASVVLELLCGDLDPDRWPVQEALARLAWAELSGTPVGSHLSAPEISPQSVRP